MKLRFLFFFILILLCMTCAQEHKYHIIIKNYGSNIFLVRDENIKLYYSLKKNDFLFNTNKLKPNKYYYYVNLYPNYTVSEEYKVKKKKIEEMSILSLADKRIDIDPDIVYYDISLKFIDYQLLIPNEELHYLKILKMYPNDDLLLFAIFVRKFPGKQSNERYAAILRINNKKEILFKTEVDHVFNSIDAIIDHNDNIVIVAQGPTDKGEYIYLKVYDQNGNQLIPKI